jgi:hypothetical protein
MSERIIDDTFGPLEIVTTELEPFSVLIDGDFNTTNLLHNSPDAKIIKNDVSLGVPATAGTT